MTPGGRFGYADITHDLGLDSSLLLPRSNRWSQLDLPYRQTVAVQNCHFLWRAPRDAPIFNEITQPFILNHTRVSLL